MTTEPNAEEQVHQLFTEEDMVQQYEEASTGQRFLNLLIDHLLMNYGLSWLSGYVVGYILVNYFPDFYVEMVLEQGVSYYFTVYLIWFLNYTAYYTLCEKLCRGYTLGKLITGTRAIREDGKELRFSDALLRTLSRIVPFEPFSGFGGHPWHDTWTHTMVVRSR